jgi:hypothetical protein
MGALLGAGACAGGPTIPPVPKLPALGAPNEPSRADAPPTEVYTRVASGANACWFAQRGALAKSHILHAEAEPPSKGGAAEIYVHERDDVGPTPWGNKVFRVALTPAGEQTEIDVRNLKLPEPLAAQMRADVFQWAVGEKGCRAGEGGTGFNKEEPAPEPAKKPKATSKVKAKPM